LLVIAIKLAALGLDPEERNYKPTEPGEQESDIETSVLTIN